MNDEQKPLALNSGLDDLGFDTGAPEEQGTATSETFKQALGNQVPKLPRIEVKHAGATVFKRKGGDQKFDKLTGVIVAFTKHNSFFGKPFEEAAAGERPKCYSNDGIKIASSATEPQAPGCAVCPRNRDGEKGSATRKAAFEQDRKTGACNNYLTVLMIVKGMGDIPFAIQFPNTSFDAWAAYAQDLLAQGKFQPHEVVTELSLFEKKKPGWKNSASVAVFKKIVAIPADKRSSYADANKSWTSYLQERSDHAAEGGAGNEGTAADAVKRAKAAEGQPAGL